MVGPLAMSLLLWQYVRILLLQTQRGAYQYFFHSQMLMIAIILCEWVDLTVIFRIKYTIGVFQNETVGG